MNRPPEALQVLVKTGEARRLRKAAGISLKTMAAGIGVSQGVLSQSERGRVSPAGVPARAWLRVLRGLAWHEQAVRVREPL